MLFERRALDTAQHQLGFCEAEADILRLQRIPLTVARLLRSLASRHDAGTRYQSCAPATSPRFARFPLTTRTHASGLRKAIFSGYKQRDPPVVLKLEIGARVCNVLRSKSANMRY
jgi:hypothetical protein